MLKLLRKSKSFFDVNYIYFDARVDKFVKRPKTRSNWVKLITCYLIFGAICLNGFYSILFTQPGILETSSILLFASPFCVSMILLSPMLLQPDPFVFLLNARQEFALRNINGNLLHPPEKLVANCKIVLKLSHILSHIVRIVAPGVLLLLMFFEPGLKPFLGSGLFIVSSKGGHLCIVVVQAWAFFSMCGPMTYFMFIFLCDSLHCAVEHLCYLKRSDDSFRRIRLTLALQIFKQLHILLAQMNFCLRNVCLPMLLVAVITPNILGMSLTILLSARLLDHVGNLFFPLAAAFTTIFIILFGTFAGYVHKWSGKCITKFGKSCAVNCDKMERKVLGRVIRSCTPMKIRFVGRGDFCEYSGTNRLFQLRPFPRGEGPKVAKIVNGAADFSMMDKDIEMLPSPKVS
ncbi:hypothetical protein Fcan01_23223 [Folsomia candida]|uniref:Uncharacterized protein n=1 Tax=Folsomia candida TaxID=158441 RepID=A0A226DAN5_FOLCA|nr:hypothetical protein Fcan01_23223 [Folsomia candida]